MLFRSDPHIIQTNRVNRLHARDEGLRKIADEMAEARLVIDKTFVPSQLPGATSHDNRTLGVRVFNTYLGAE